MHMKILFVTSEAHPLIKTGGLADVSNSLPRALSALRQDVRLVMPAYRCITTDERPRPLFSSHTARGDSYRLLETRLPGTRIPVYLVDIPMLYDRPGGPYADEQGRDWPDNAHRFAAFADVVAQLTGPARLSGWQPDILHCNDWQTGLVPVILRDKPHPPVLFTIHNLAYQGIFAREWFERLGLDDTLWSMHALEFYGSFSFMKGGLVYADWITTVSPTYADEIMRPEFGCGLEGVLQSRADRLSGILNGIDTTAWDPRHDPLIAQTYNARKLSDKRVNRDALCRHFGIEVGTGPLCGSIGRLVWQKGIDLIIDLLPELLTEGWRFVFLGSGETDIENRLCDLARQFPGRLGVEIGYHERLAHLIEAGADIFVMPSRFEPCGMNQMYSMRYGTPPVVRRTGGLADTVSCANGGGDGQDITGFCFDEPNADALRAALRQAAESFSDRRRWQQIMRNAMRREFGWRSSARQYLARYQALLRQ